MKYGLNAAGNFDSTMFQSQLNTSDDGRLKTQDEIKFETKLDREMKLVDKRVASLQEWLNTTLNNHQGQFSKQFDQIANASNAISNKSFKKLEQEAQNMTKVYNYAKFYEKQRLASFEQIQQIMKKAQSLAQAEPMQKKQIEEQKLKKNYEVDEGIDREEFNCEISQHILERNREEAILVKEKVKEIQKVILELDKKIKNAKILETFAIHQREEIQAEYTDYYNKMQKIKDQQNVQKQEMSSKCKEIEGIIESKKDVQKNRERSQDIIRKRAERLKKSIEKLRERESRFQKIAQNQKNENDRFISQFENLCSNFKTEKPDEINHKYIQKTLENQSIVNWFNDLAKHIFDLKMKKEDLQKELKIYIKNNTLMLTQNDALRFDKGEYNEQRIENRILLNRQKTQKLVTYFTQLILLSQAEILRFKKESVFSIINGMKHLARKIQADGEVNQSAIKYEPQNKYEISDINFPQIVGLCSQLSLIVEKKFSYQMQYNEQYFGFKVVLLKGGRDRSMRYQTVQQMKQNYQLHSFTYRTLIYGQTGIESLRKIYEEYKRVSSKKSKSMNNIMVEKRSSIHDSQNGDDMGQSEGEEEEDNNSFLDEGSGFVSDNNVGDLEGEISVEKDGFFKAKETLQLGKNLIVKKHNLSSVQEGEDFMPFSKKMDQALNFIDEVLMDNIAQFDTFGKTLDQSELEIVNGLEDKRREQKNKQSYLSHTLEQSKNMLKFIFVQDRAKTAADVGALKNQLMNLNETFNSQSTAIGGQSAQYRQQVAVRKQREIAAANGFYNKGISDFGFINMICETNKEFKEVDSRLHKLSIQRLGKASSLPSLELKKLSMQQHQIQANNNSFLQQQNIKSAQKSRRDIFKTATKEEHKDQANNQITSPIMLRTQLLKSDFSQSQTNFNNDQNMRKFMSKRTMNAEEFLQVYKKKVEDFKKSQKDKKRELNKKQKMLMS